MRPFTLLVKPAGPDCNIACSYCFYACKTCVFGQGRHRMSDEVQETLVKSYMSLRFEGSSFAWQGGEPTLMGLDFYKRLVGLQQKYGEDGQLVTNALQTNGILLDDDWCKFLAEYKFLVGISLDGPKHYHDIYRLDRAGAGTYDRVVAGIEKCRQHHVEFNILVLLNDKNVDHPDELFDFFVKEKKIKYLQFVQCVERDPETDKIAAFSITPKQYGEFLCRIFDLWMEYGTNKVSIRTFDSVVSYLLGMGHTECTLGPQCNDYIVIEHNGDAFCCDFYVDDKWRLGNIRQTPIEQLAGAKLKRQFSRNKRDIDNKCLVCRHLDICRGGCPKDRMAGSGTHKAPSYFCEGYKLFFDHTLGHFRRLATELQRQQAGAGERSPNS
ncbi:MAG: anaerobic sulfatase maturase [Planctomycetota bacterium]|nr:MAG: anaerobic sulfatase maturase [Planctomycetota bacterium]